jgi:hypothetical protein
MVDNGSTFFGKTANTLENFWDQFVELLDNLEAD